MPTDLYLSDLLIHFCIREIKGVAMICQMDGSNHNVAGYIRLIFNDALPCNAMKCPEKSN